MGGCGGLERTHFEQFLLWEGVVVLKELILNSFYLKELILNSFYFGRVWWSWKNSFWTVSTWKNWFWTVSTLGGCRSLERSHFEQFLLWEGVVVLKELHFEQFLLWEGVLVLKEHMGDAQGSIGDIQGGVWTCRGVEASGGVWMYGVSKYIGVSRCPKHMGGCQLWPPSVKPKCH